jgi:hydrogenase-1 operon protein HyaF
MTKLHDINIEVRKVSDAGPGMGVNAILYELAGMLEVLIAKGRGNAIDLRGLPLTPGEYSQLRATLGEGEVNAEVSALGPTRIRETAIHGVWWVTHYNAQDQILAEFLEVTVVPQLLKTESDDIREGLDLLHERLAAST